jgi:transcriptional regulator with XRE-family HTH domain
VNTVAYDQLLEVLRNAREQAGIGQEALSKRLGQSPMFVYKVEEKQRRLDVVEFAEYVSALGQSPEEVFRAWMRLKDK